MGPGPIGSLPLATPLEMPLLLPLSVFYTVEINRILPSGATSVAADAAGAARCGYTLR